jgi:hypothetical protein
VQDADSFDSKLESTTEAIENIPPGWRARETYLVHGPDEFEEIVELAEAGKPFEVYSRARLKSQMNRDAVAGHGRRRRSYGRHHLPCRRDPSRPAAGAAIIAA